MLFKAQYGQWPQLIGNLCEGKTIEDTHWNMLDVRDLALAQVCFVFKNDEICIKKE